MLESEADTAAEFYKTIIGILVANHGQLITYLDAGSLDEALLGIALRCAIARIAAIDIELVGTVSEVQVTIVVLFTSPSSGRNVGHVGIVVDVDPITHTFNFIHASTSDGVKISNSNEGFYARRFVGVRRVF